jgi:hypothetical protein
VVRLVSSFRPPGWQWVFDARFVDESLLEKRALSAASFSMYCRYSSSVVAPTQCSSPAPTRFQHVACIHRAFRLTGADHGMQFVDNK